MDKGRVAGKRRKGKRESGVSAKEQAQMKGGHHEEGEGTHKPYAPKAGQRGRGTSSPSGGLRADATLAPRPSPRPAPDHRQPYPKKRTTPAPTSV